MAKTAKKQVVKKITKHVPYVISPNHSIRPLRTQREETIENLKYPLGRYDFPVAIVHGSRTPNAYERIRQVTEGNGIYINHPDSISNASDKLVSKRLFVENNVPTTPFQSVEELLSKGKFYSSKLTLNYPIVAKLRNGSGGNGMSLIKDKDELLKWRKSVGSDLTKYFFEEVFNWNGDLTTHFKKTREYRISCSPLLFSKSLEYSEPEVDEEGNIVNENVVVESEGVIVALRKLMTNEGVANGNFGRNLALGHSRFVRNFNKREEFKKRGVSMVWEEGVIAALNACRALGLDYGAVDILWSSTTGEWCVIEVNTAPAMGSPEEGQTYTLGRWRDGFRYMIEEKRKLQIENNL